MPNLNSEISGQSIQSDLTNETIFKSDVYHQKNDRCIGQSRTALLISEGLAYGSSRQFLAMLEGNVSTTFQLFTNEVEALKWLLIEEYKKSSRFRGSKLSKRNKTILSNILINIMAIGVLYFYVVQPVNISYLDYNPNPECQNCAPTILIGLFVGILICVIRGSDDPLPKPKTGAKKSEVALERSIWPGVYMFLYLAVSYSATPQFRYLFQIGSFSSLLLFFTFQLLLNLHYRREDTENSIPNDADKTMAWLDELATKNNEEIDRE